MEPYYSDESVTLYHGDCLAVLPEITGVDLVVTSPPYNLSVGRDAGKWPHDRGGKWVNAGAALTYDDHDDALPLAEYVRWQRDVLTACWATLSDTGAIFYNHKPRHQNGAIWLPLEVNPGLPLRQIVIWSRAGGMNYAPTHYMPTHEWICVFAKPEWRLKNRAASGVGDVWRIRQEANPDHPAPFPVGLPARVIETTAPSLVLDPFAGSGTTLRAARDAGVKAIGIEKSEHYCQLTARRLDQGVLDFEAVT